MTKLELWIGGKVELDTLPLSSKKERRKIVDDWMNEYKECGKECFIKIIPIEICTKMCSLCKKDIDVELFCKNMLSKDGRSGQCKDCDRKKRIALQSRRKRENLIFH